MVHGETPITSNPKIGMGAEQLAIAQKAQGGKDFIQGIEYGEKTLLPLLQKQNYSGLKSMRRVVTKIMLGDCREKLKELHDNSIDLVVTSPPYADNRQSTYGGIKPNQYVQWFLPISQELRRVVKPAGTFILNIKERTVNGERHPYVIELILGMRKQGWIWTEEFIWHKKNSYPGKWPNRFRDSWERFFEFNKAKDFNIFHDVAQIL